MNVCEKCKKPKEFMRFYKRYNKHLCDECVDKLDGTWNMGIYLDENNNMVAEFPMKNRKIIMYPSGKRFRKVI